MKNTFFVLLIISLSCASNADKIIEIKVTTPEAKLVVNSFNDSTFFSKISGIVASEADQSIFFIDQNLGTVFHTDLSLNLKRKIGQVGMGPNEINTPTQVSLKNDQLYVYDGGNGKIMSYPMNSRADSASVHEFRFKYYGIGNFFVRDSMVYFSDRRNHPSPIVKFNLANLSVSQEFGLPAQKGLNTPQRHVISVKSGMLSVYAENAAIIEYYDYSGNLIDSFDLSDYPIFKDRLTVDPSKSIIIKGATKQTFPVYKNIIWDVKMIDDKLYLLVLSKKDETSAQSNTVLVMDWVNEKLRITEQINLPKKGWYSRFTILERSKQIVAFDEVNGTIEIFNTSR